MLARKKMLWIIHLSFNQIYQSLFFNIVYSIRLIFNFKIKDSDWGGSLREGWVVVN